MERRIDHEEVAKQAYSSSFHFQRIFRILCGFTLGNYVRMRRLSLAGNELSSSSVRVIDIALKSFSSISVKMVLNGGNIMNYRFETKAVFQLVCKKMRLSCQAEMRMEEISAFWKACSLDGTISALCKYLPQSSIFGNCIVGATFGKDAAEPEFPYAIGTPYNGVPISDTDLTVEKIPAHTYVVFSCTCKMPEAFSILYHQIFSEFFPTSEYQPCGGTDFEVYPSADVTNPDYACEIWVAYRLNCIEKW